MPKVEYEVFTLDNGLRVIVHEDHSLPKAVINILYRVGSRDEDPNRTGFAHLFEHLMFEGSRNIENYDLPLQRAGGSNNAFTSSDITNYYLSLPANQLETGFWLESDRMLELAFSEKSLAVQKSVVIEEYKQRYLNVPYGDAQIILRDLHFTTHPYKWPTIGESISHIEEATLEEVKEFFYNFYAPNNATLVVAGDVKRKEVEFLANKWFAPIPYRNLGKRKLPIEPKQTTAKTKKVYKNVPYPGVYKMFHIPPRTDREYLALSIITALLSYGKGGMLYQSIVQEKELATSANAFCWEMCDPGALSINARLSQGKSPELYEKALWEVIDSIQHISDQSLERIKNVMETYEALEYTKVINRAMALAFADFMGDPDLVNTEIESYKSLTPDEVKAAALKYLQPENSSTLYYLPQI